MFVWSFNINLEKIVKLLSEKKFLNCTQEPEPLIVGLPKSVGIFLSTHTMFLLSLKMKHSMQGNYVETKKKCDCTPGVKPLNGRWQKLLEILFGSYLMNVWSFNISGGKIKLLSEKHIFKLHPTGWTLEGGISKINRELS